jgi:hypothetical protein
LTPDDVADVIVFAVSRRENVVIADTLIYPNHQVTSLGPATASRLSVVNVSDIKWAIGVCHDYASAASYLVGRGVEYIGKKT